MPDLKKLYTPTEATLLYNSNKIKFNPTAYSLKEHLILNRNCEEMESETISTYGFDAENILLAVLSDKEGMSWELNSKVPTRYYKKLPIEHSGSALIKEYNLSIALDYLVNHCSLDSHKLKNSLIMDAIVRMCIALDSVESCCREMYWFITDLWNLPYETLHNFEHVKQSLESTEILALGNHCGVDVIYNNAPNVYSESITPELNVASMYKAKCYVLEFLWAYYRLNDAALQRALAWNIHNSGGCAIFQDWFVATPSEIVVCDAIKALVTIEHPADRFKAYQEYLQTYDKDILAWAALTNNEQHNPVVAMFISYAEGIAVANARVNTLGILYTYCNSKGYIDSTEEDMLRDAFESSAIGSLFENTALDKSLMDLGTNTIPNEAEACENSKKSNNDNGIFEALDTLNASFKAGGYSYTVKDVRVGLVPDRTAYDKICEKVSLVNRELIRKIRDIKVYNTGGKNPGMASGKLDRKAMYRYKHDPNIFYNNTYKQLESDLAFGIILDMSGSMSGSGIENGKITMIVLHETLKALGINHSIIGHTSTDGDYTCTIERYQSFKEDKTYTVCKNYALADIREHACNCDSGALYYMEKAMERVQNRDKIVLIFSDGYPTACTGTDLINQVQAMEAKGIKVIGIGIDFPSISKYYSEYANGRNLKDMLDIVTTILQDYILKKKVD